MILLLMFVGIILSIIKANEWIVIPTSCIVFCWVVSFFILDDLFLWQRCWRRDYEEK